MPQGHDGIGGGVQIRVKQQPGVLHRKIGNGVEHGFGDEGQRALGANQQVLEDVHGLVEIEKRIQRIAGGVLHPVLVAHPLAQAGVGLQLRFQGEDAARQFRFARMKFLIGVGQRRIDDGPRRQHELHRVQRVIGVLLDAATHAAGVVGEYSAQGASRDGCGIGADLGAIRNQQPGWRAPR